MRIRLDKNEMFKPPPKEIIDPVKESIENINRYTPQVKVEELIGLISDYTKVPQDSIILSSASDILIKEFIYLFARNRQIIIADPTFILITNTAQKTSSPLLKIRLREPEFKISLEQFIDEINKPTMIVFDNPNNTTGSLLLNKKDVKTVLENENVIFLIDEAYFEFSKISYVNLLIDFPNLAIVRTLSKSFGLAGSGIGYILCGDVIKRKFIGLEIMLPYPSVVAAINALHNLDYMKKYIKEIEQEKKRIVTSVSKMGITVFPSYTNFILMKTGIENISQKLLKQKIYVHDVSEQLSSEYIRVTIGTEKENDYFLRYIEQLTKS
ncbi:MAG: histidinol-phosphate aminotransferase family protein [Candidatus Lokiarchaeota archaeon]|nr:histidinol-phosphate aminotransferase family protein [Candidatus Lokiarchaeota archaeon]